MSAEKPAEKQTRKQVAPARNRPPQVPLQGRTRPLDAIILALLLTGPCLSPFLYGASRIETIWPFYLSTQLGLVLCFCKPLLLPSFRRYLPPPGVWIALLMLGYTAAHWLALSQIPYASRVELCKHLNYFAVVLAWTEMAASRGRWRWLLAALVLTATAQAWYAFVQDWNGSNLVLARERPAQYGMRASGTFICPNHFAHFLAMVVTACAGLLFTRGAGALLRGLSLYALPLCGYTIFLSRSRSGLIGLAVGVSVVWLLLAMRRGIGRTILVLAALLLLGGGAITAAWHLDPHLRQRIEEARHGDIRLILWPDTIDMIKASPVAGTGPGTYRHTFAPFRDLYRTADSTVRYAHNEYLHTLAETGGLGLAIVLALLAWIAFRFLRVVFRAERSRDAALAAVVLGVLAQSMAHSVFDFQFQLFANVHAFLLIVGVIAGRLYVSGELTPIRANRLTRIPLALGMIAALFVTAAWITQDWDTARQKRLGEAYDQLLIDEGWIGDDGRMIRDPDANLDRYAAAARRNPSHWLGHSLLGRAHSHKGLPLFLEEDRVAELHQAQTHLEAALLRNPFDDESLHALAATRAALGQSKQALADMRRLIELEPFHIDYHLGYARMLADTEDWATALAHYETAEELSRGIESNPVAAAIIAAGLKRCRAQLGL